MLAKIAIRLKKSGLAVAVTMMGGIVAVDIQLICCNQAGRVAQKSSLKSCVLKECSHTYISPAGGQSTPQLVYWMLVINIMMLALIVSLPYQQLFTYVIMYI